MAPRRSISPSQAASISGVTVATSVAVIGVQGWDMVARYVVPEINGYVTKLRESEKYLQQNRGVFDRAGQAVMAKIMENKDAAEALKVTSNPRVSAAAAQVPKGLDKQAAK